METVVSDAMDLVYENSVSVIHLLQIRFQQQSGLFFLISNVFDPRYAFLFFAPLILSFDRSLGKKILFVSIVAEWSNQVLKWMLHGERPYWWIHETGVYNRTGSRLPDIQQYFLTCETGPGSPSGHAMCSASLWYVVVESLLRKVGAINKNSSVLSSMCWSTYTLVLAAVSLSRVFIAAHFPHQCVLGMAIGVLVAMAAGKIDLDRLKLKHYVLLTIGLFSSALCTYAVLQLMGMNPMWSVDRAVKWCAKQEYIHLDTTPFFSMTRYCGFALGMGLGLSSSLFARISSVKFPPFAKAACAVLALSVAKLSERIVLPKANIYLFYGLAFALNVVLPYVFLAVVPYIVFRCWCLLDRKQKVL
ncbi:glucose-6-phosphatase 2 [Centruroides vittatus]|uniref:glucose-6-phosphatase 2 n=1 Tax=Centruroides vittatus TaxID=120091 RepID=UPI00350E902A